MEIEQIYDQIKDIGQWFSKEDVISFSKLQIPKGATILELGTGHGRSTKALRLLFPTAKISSCDPGYQGEAGLMEKLNVNFISEAGYILDWTEPLDLLFIDDDHEEKTVRLDIQKFKSLVKKNGYIVCHDYYGTGVEKAVNALLPGAKILQTGEFSQAIWRNI